MNVITWNMQGATGFRESKWNTDVTRLFLAGAEIICLQECGNPPPSAVQIASPPWLAGYAIPGGINGGCYLWSIGTRSRGISAMIVWLETDPVGHRVNEAVVFSLGAVMPTNLMLIPNGGGGRPAIGARLRSAAGNVADFYSIHARADNGGLDGPGLITGIVGVGAAAWFAAGDFNRNPNTWPGYVPVGAVLAGHNGATTHPGSGTNLDYAFAPVGTNFAGIVSSGFVVSDHYPVAYVL